MTEKNVTVIELLNLIREIEKKYQFKIKKIGNFQASDEFIHFRENFTFVNLPYSKKVTAWSDRNAFQRLIRQKFDKLFKPGDLVVIPGCADGQIPIEVYANSIKNSTPLEIIAADFNLPAMQLGYLAMKSFGLKEERINWTQADIKSREFFKWIELNFQHAKRNQIITLIQPSLREKNFIDLLRQCSYLHKSKLVPTKIVMPVLLEDENSSWYRTCNNSVQNSIKISEKEKELPKLMWNKTKYGCEMLRLDPTMTFYLPQQYFIKFEALSKIQEEMGYLDSNEIIFEELGIENNQKTPTISREIEGVSKRIFCVWSAKN